jgi:hypothetical protein
MRAKSAGAVGTRVPRIGAVALEAASWLRALALEGGSLARQREYAKPEHSSRLCLLIIYCMAPFTLHQTHCLPAFGLQAKC